MLGALRQLRQQWIGVLGVVLGLTGIAYGATGQPAILGKANDANAVTTIQNMSNGPAVKFKVRSGQPPFAVSSGVQVANLNAARLGGKLPSAFAPAGEAYTKAAADARFAEASELGSYYTKTAADARFTDSTEIGDYYDKTQADAAFAPASGSQNYLPAGYRVLDIVRFDLHSLTSTGGLDSQTLYDQVVAAPGHGVIILTVSGLCHSVTGTLNAWARDSDPPTTITMANDQTFLCNAVSTTQVDAGILVHSKATLTADLDALSEISYGAITLEFRPQ